MRSGTTTINNNGVHETCETMLFDYAHVTTDHLAALLRQCPNAKIQLMQHERFQVIGVSNDLVILAPLDWEGYDETDINAVHDGTARSDHDDPEQAVPICPRSNSGKLPKCCAHKQVYIEGGE